ncbi:hypothetical protein Tco_1122599 [Tanacetum coccineum]|uniref:Uncharacterized protein n=1 Tax=Tanacetum coccineum TaxID=301880 RepID=A0ABQ5J172_9ASTR
MSLMHQWHDTICGGVISPRHSLLYGAYGCILDSRDLFRSFFYLITVVVIISVHSALAQPHFLFLWQGFAAVLAVLVTEASQSRQHVEICGGKEEDVGLDELGEGSKEVVSKIGEFGGDIGSELLGDRGGEVLFGGGKGGEGGGL